MLNLSILIVIVGLIYWLLRLRRRGFFKRLPKENKIINKIFGQEVQVFLDYDTPIEHIAFDGIRFGQQFRYKSLDEIGLPEKCNFRIIPIYYSSDTLFHEELPNETHDHNVFGIISLEEAKLLKKGLLMARMQTNNLGSSEIISHLFADSAHSKFAEKMQHLINQAIQSSKPNIDGTANKDQSTSANQ